MSDKPSHHLNCNVLKGQNNVNVMEIHRINRNLAYSDTISIPLRLWFRRLWLKYFTLDYSKYLCMGTFDTYCVTFDWMQKDGKILNSLLQVKWLFYLLYQFHDSETLSQFVTLLSTLKEEMPRIRKTWKIPFLLLFHDFVCAKKINYIHFNQLKMFQNESIHFIACIWHMLNYFFFLLLDVICTKWRIKKLKSQGWRPRLYIFLLTK